MPENPQTEFNITKQDSEKTLSITNTKKKGTVITHYYIEGTTDKVPLKTGGVAEDLEQIGNVGDIYATKEVENIADNYEFVEVQGETSGEIVEGTTEIIYYYRIKEPTITTPQITKESSIEKVTNVGQTIDYTINYNTTVDKYIGRATITIVDQLPYEIDEQNSNIAGGTYNKANKTITWTEEVGEIDTFVNGAKEIRIRKTNKFSIQKCRYNKEHNRKYSNRNNKLKDTRKRRNSRRYKRNSSRIFCKYRSNKRVERQQ